ncbi:MAG: hypothetical protein QXR01_03135 [Candidatus Bathyarchaeia archaeon]
MSLLESRRDKSMPTDPTEQQAHKTLVAVKAGLPKHGTSAGAGAKFPRRRELN